jgi:hypothetical protein
MSLFKIPNTPIALPMRDFDAHPDDYTWEDWHGDALARYPVRYRLNSLADWFDGVVIDWFRAIPRRCRFWWQRRTRGWDDSETWSLDATCAEWLLPRLKRLREIQVGMFEVEPDVYRELDEVEWFLELHAKGDTWDLLSNPEMQKRYDAAAPLLGKHFGRLWW